MIWSVLEVVGDSRSGFHAFRAEKGIDCWSFVNYLHEMIRFRDQCLGKDQQWVFRQKNTVGQNISLDQGEHKDFSLPNLPPFPPPNIPNNFKAVLEEDGPRLKYCQVSRQSVFSRSKPHQNPIMFPGSYEA